MAEISSWFTTLETGLFVSLSVVYFLYYTHIYLFNYRYVCGMLVYPSHQIDIYGDFGWFLCDPIHNHTLSQCLFFLSFLSFSFPFKDVSTYRLEIYEDKDGHI